MMGQPVPQKRHPLQGEKKQHGLEDDVFYIS